MHESEPYWAINCGATTSQGLYTRLYTRLFTGLHLYASGPHLPDEGDGHQIPRQRHESHQAVLGGFVFKGLRAAEDGL